MAYNENTFSCSDIPAPAPTKKTMINTRQPSLELTVKRGSLSRLSTLLQRGFLVPCPGPVPLYDVLLALPGFDHEYITGHIETIFINGTAGDSLQELIFPGNAVALSAAMPGLAGAIFRKGGVHASLRSKPVTGQSPQTPADGFITIKLFNMIATDKAEELLTRGILIRGPALAQFFHRQQERLHTLLIDIRENTSPLSLKEACLLAESHVEIRLKVHAV